MITLAALAELAGAAGNARAAGTPEDSGLAPVGPLLIGDSSIDIDACPAIMGTVNLSRDSTYRESVAISTASAVRKARVQWAQGASVIDIGAESSTARAARVDGQAQAAALVPVIDELTGSGIAVSVETYLPQVAQPCLQAGARVLNLTGSQFQRECFDLAAAHGATVVLCYVAGDNVREITDVDLDDPFPILLDHLGARVELARAHGVERIVLDPGLGFFYGNLVDPMTRVRHQARVLLSTFRLRDLGLPICHALPHAFDLFEDQFRQAEAYFAVLAYLGGTSLMRTHEVASVHPVLRAMTVLQA